MLSRSNWSQSLQERCLVVSSKMVSIKPFEENKNGLRKMCKYVISLFKSSGLEIEIVENPNADYRPIIIARLDSNKDTTVGFFGHYDVEPVSPEKWSTDPWSLTNVDGRWQGRGVADNIVPLVQKILLLPELAKHANLVFVLQGEEEIGSPFSMKEYPKLNLPKVDIWFEETGYFYKNGDHRIMAMNVNEKLENVFSSLEDINSGYGINTKLRIRPMNKAFGNQGCPCLVHLVGQTPYIALGPNDDYSTIHGANESINPDLLYISASQIIRAVEVFAS